MATVQRIVYGATVKWGTDGSTWDDIPECKGIAVPTVEIEYLDATHLESTGGYREFVPGLKDAGSITIPCGYSTEAYALAEGYQSAGTLVYFQTILPTETGQTAGDTFEFTGYVVPQLEQNEVGAIISLNLIIRTSGAPTYTEATTV